jgi:ribonucleoside-diphosphate reductase alpha chain
MANNLPTDYQTYIHASRYARWIPEKNRRETWEETVDRYINFFKDRSSTKLTSDTLELIKGSIIDLEVMPSMRCLMTAGEALDRDNVAGFNCAYTHIQGKGEVLELEHPKLDQAVQVNLTKPIDWDEGMYVLMCGTGLGFSVERQFITNLPKVGAKLNRRIYLPNNKNYPGVDKEEISRFNSKTNCITVHDSKYGWASALRILIVELYNGNFNVTWDTSGIRPAGAKLKVFGGRASGPAPLVSLFSYVKEIFSKANGRKLTSIECHDITCKVAEVVVVGGVRRSALISLSNLTDDRMRVAKSGNWYDSEPQRALANNSVSYTETPDIHSYLKEMLALYDSKSGERGLFNRNSALKFIPERRKLLGYTEFGTNPCSEIILRSKQFCNLTEVVVRPTDTVDDLKRKVRDATILGTFQSTLTDFVYLSDEWSKNTKEESLLGVSLTGIMDHELMNGSLGVDELKEVLEVLKNVAIETNIKWAKILGVNPSTAITCVKPSGTVSQLVDSASGIHQRYASYYIRRVRNDVKDPVTAFLQDQGVEWEYAITKEGETPSTVIFSFPMRAPTGSIMRDDRTALEQLEIWKLYQVSWCEHKPSITVYVKEEEWPMVINWVYTNFNYISGISFLPHSDHAYLQAPYEDLTEEQYIEMKSKTKAIDWSLLPSYEVDDSTINHREYACAGGACEIL